MSRLPQAGFGQLNRDRPPPVPPRRHVACRGHFQQREKQPIGIDYEETALHGHQSRSDGMRKPLLPRPTRQPPPLPRTTQRVTSELRSQHVPQATRKRHLPPMTDCRIYSSPGEETTAGHTEFQTGYGLLRGGDEVTTAAGLRPSHSTVDGGEECMATADSVPLLPISQGLTVCSSASEYNSATVTPLGCKGRFLCLLYALLQLATLASFVPRATLMARCQARGLPENACLNTSNASTWYVDSLSSISSSMWNFHTLVVVVILIRSPGLFDRPVKRGSIFRRLRKLHHFWTFLMVVMCSIAYEAMTLALSRSLASPIALTTTYALVAGCLRILLKGLTFILVCVLNYTPDMNPRYGRLPRYLFKLNLLLFTLLQFCYFVATSVYVVMKVMPDGTPLNSKAGSTDVRGQDVKRVITLLLAVLTAVYHAKMAHFFSAKISSTNKNLLHFVHEEIFWGHSAVNSRYFSGVSNPPSEGRPTSGISSTDVSTANSNIALRLRNTASQQCPGPSDHHHYRSKAVTPNI